MEEPFYLSIFEEHRPALNRTGLYTGPIERVNRRVGEPLPAGFRSSASRQDCLDWNKPVLIDLTPLGNFFPVRAASREGNHRSDLYSCPFPSPSVPRRCRGALRV